MYLNHLQSIGSQGLSELQSKATKFTEYIVKGENLVIATRLNEAQRQITMNLLESETSLINKQIEECGKAIGRLQSLGNS